MRIRTGVRHLLAGIALLGATGLAAGTGTYAALSSTTSNAGDSFAAGTVALSDNDAGSAMLSLADAQPGDSTTGCFLVTYAGSLDSSVRLYASVSGGLASYLTLTVERGTDTSPSFSDCSSFTPDATDHVGAGPGVVYSGLLSDYPGSYAAGVVDPTSAAPETWTTNEARSYRLTVSLVNDAGAEGLSASAEFLWEARNL